ncbi:hypothetical protein NMYAN_10447 [Nitrosomonas nitrosa]|uniref:Uncharacterized protein n=1 Tax=Nitrosomonas nitrosa TaxID=52442 RepID=A0A8H8YY01_9PROT|nr:hypothetical protein NMYAN_10447 [Nitrosomonas nitrosa]
MELLDDNILFSASDLNQALNEALFLCKKTPTNLLSKS